MRNGIGELGTRDGATVIRGALLFDGEQWRGECDVMINAGSIVAIGPVDTIDARPDMFAVEASGAVLAPGFIDIHGMDRCAPAVAGKDAINFLSQGVTTLVIGNCGVGTPEGAAPDLAINIVELAGHNAARTAVPATVDAIRWLRSHLERRARGVSLGLMYEPGRSVASTELAQIGQLVAEHQAVLAIHMRDEGPGLLSSIEEVLAIRGGARTVVMHLKACGERNWPQLEHGRDLLARETVRWTYYPYADTNTRLAAAVPFQFDSPSSLRRLLQDSELRARFREGGLQTLARRGWDGVVITDGPQSLVGRSISALALACEVAPEDAVAALLADDANVRVRFADVADLNGIRASAGHELAMAASDAYVFDSTAMNPEHPRSFGAIARSLRWAREGNYLDKFLRSVTSRAADLYTLPRGRISVGAAADLVLFDVADVEDKASYDEPALLAVGVRTVWVSGCVAYEGQRTTASRLGSVL